MKKIALALCVGLLAFPAYAGAAGLTVSKPRTENNGVAWYDAVSPYNGPGSTTLRVLSPNSPAGMSHRFIYVLPVINDVGLDDPFGDGLEALRALNVHNDFNAHIIAPSFDVVPWYGDHDSASDRRYESFIVRELVPWVQANLSVTGQEEHWLIGFSKSGFGAVTLLLRNPGVFAAAAAWDFPADQADTSIWSMLDNYGTDANFQTNYRLTSDWISARKEPFQSVPRLWLSYDQGMYLGVPTFLSAVSAFAGRLQANQMRFMRTGGETRDHSWTSGWLSRAVAGLQGMRYAARDDFNRADGGLGPNWTVDPKWGNGGTVTGNRVSAPMGNGGAYFWTAKSFGPDQYSQIKITGVIGDSIGVAVRGRISPGQAYSLSVKSDGVDLYSFLNGEFYFLAHDSTHWASGDTLRLEVRTVGARVARLSVRRNGSVLFTYDDADHFIESGNPGIGLFATTNVSLDDWRGGELNGVEAPTPLTIAGDNFDRADGGLGPNWTVDPTWGNGGSVTRNRVSAAIGNGGAYLWTANSFGADQYSQIRLTGAVGDSVGVAVRGRISPGQGYSVSIKNDGAYLYSFLKDQFYLLAHDSTAWATGDTLRLEVRTAGANVARLSLRRNGNVLFTYDDTAHFIGSGNPGIGLFAAKDVSLDDWQGGELSESEELLPPAAPVATARDDFNRPDGTLGPNWMSDSQWGSSGSVTENRVSAPMFTGGTHLWAVHNFGVDHYSQVKLTGTIGDWAGVAVRGRVSPAQGYSLAVKGDGAYLYSFRNGQFNLLVHDTNTWATGDTLRLEVRTVAPNVARLWVHRNGSLLFTHEDAVHFIESGRPGIGLFASTDVSLDDWEGGTLAQLP